MAYATGQDSTGEVSIKVLVPLFSLGLFTCCMVCHGELVRLKPHPRYLTHFYVMISAGGALGGIFVGLVAPLLFNAFYELPNRPGVLRGAGVCGAAAWTRASASGSADGAGSAPARGRAADRGHGRIPGDANRATGTRDSARAGAQFLRRAAGARYRSGFVARSTRTLTHGTINHGEEYLNPARRRPAHHLLRPEYRAWGWPSATKQKNGAIRVGVVGLGTGTIAAYGRLGDYYRYYEINPLVPPDHHARSSISCRMPKAKVEIAMGDARLSLEREAPENFDVLAVDAFSSDSIPVHLLTREAMELFFRHLKPDGMLAVHISNRYLDLEPVIEGETRATGKIARVVDTEDDESVDVFGATWVLVTSPQPGFDTGLSKFVGPDRFEEDRAAVDRRLQ